MKWWCYFFCVFSLQAIKHTLAVLHSFSPKAIQTFLINKTNQKLKHATILVFLTNPSISHLYPQFPPVIFQLM